MRTIAIVFALTVVGGAAPAAPYGRGYLSTALLVFAAALVVLLAACLVSGWLVWELRTLMRMARSRSGPAGMPAPAAQPSLLPARSFAMGRPRRVATRAPQASASRSRPAYPRTDDNRPPDTATPGGRYHVR